VIRRRIFSADPPPGDYILTTTGLTWNLDCRSAGDSVLRLVAGEQHKPSALAKLLELAERDSVDAWETFGAGSYRLIERYRLPK